jgi:hypothetical protein
MEAIQAVQSIPPAFLNAAQTAEFMGVSPGMVRKMIKDDRLPVRRFGRCVRVPAAWLANEAATAMKGKSVIGIFCLVFLLTLPSYGQILAPIMFRTGAAGGATCTPASGYSHCRVLTIDHTQIPSTLTNFPVTAWNSFTLGASRIQNASCFDVIFTSDSAGTTKIPWEIESCVQATGAIVAHFLDASASSTVDGKFYVSYQNAAISTAQNTAGNAPTAVWDSSYKRVYHMANNAATTTVTDSTTTANGTSVNNTSTMQNPGELGGSFTFASTDRVSVAPITFTGATAAWTLSAWIKTSAGDMQIFGFRSSVNAQPVLDIVVGNNAISNSGTGKPAFLVRDDAGNGLTGAPVAAAAVNDNAWHYLVASRDSSKSILIYIDGSVVVSGADTMTTSTTFDADAILGFDSFAGMATPTGLLHQPPRQLDHR